MRIARLGALAEARSAARRAMPPFEHVAFAKLLARVQHDLRARQARLEQDQRQDVLQLVAIAGRPAALVRPDAAPEARSVELIGQPDIDQPVEVRPVGADLDLAEPLGPRGARRGEFGLGARDADARRGGERFLAGRRLAEDDRDLRLAARRKRDLAANAATRRPSSRAAPSLAPVSTIAGVWMSRPGPPKKRARMVSVAGASRLVAAKANPRSKSLRGFLEQERRADRLVVDLVDALVRAFLEREIEERRDAQALRTRPAIAQGQKTHVARTVGRNEHDIVHLEIAARLREGRDARLVVGLVCPVLALERGEAGRVGLADLEVAQVDDLPRLHDGRAVEAKGGQPVLAGVGEGGEDLAVVRDHRRHAEFVGHHMRPGARRAMGEARAPCRQARRRTASGSAARATARPRGSRRRRFCKSASGSGAKPRRRATSSAAHTALSARPTTNSASAAPLGASVTSRVKLAAGSNGQSLPSSSSLRQRQARSRSA